jgi:hydrogenase nickel incorporation protein HypA/HybF
MHELGLMRTIVDTVGRYAAENNMRQVARITLEVGQLSGVVPESLAFCFDVCAKGSALEGAELDMRRIEAVGECSECQRNFNLIASEFTCPICSSPKWSLVTGKEFTIKFLEGI